MIMKFAKKNHFLEQKNSVIFTPDKHCVKIN